MYRKIALFANGDVGLSIAKYLATGDDEVVALFLADQYPLKDKEILNSLSEKRNLHIRSGDVRNDVHANFNLFKELGVDTIITVYWPFILPTQLIDLAELTINFHPALLPLNRGWYPHVYNLLNGSPAGVTLHQLSPAVDEGDIWAQKTVEVYPWDCASDLYLRLQLTITTLFIDNWPLIKNGRMVPMPQNKIGASYHSKKEIELLDEIDLLKKYSGAELINLLRARTFGDKGFAYFKTNEGKVFLSLRLEKQNE